MAKVKIAVVSDLHCYYDKVGNKANPESYLVSNMLRRPVNRHPVQALQVLIKHEELKVDYLFCPGDIANKADLQGFISGWNYINEIANSLGVEGKEIIATIGNHDVDSRHIGSSQIFEVAKGIEKGFPVIDKICCEEFYSNGFTFIETDKLRVLLINSVFFHDTQEEIDRGKVDNTQIEQIEKYIKENAEDKIKIVLCHHHPIVHERLNLGSTDVIVNGNNLIDILNRNKFDLFIHGHKHDPWLRYAPGSLNCTPIFAAGSFSATTNQIITGKRNTFHIIEIIKEEGVSIGTIKTWEYLPNVGWREADSGESGFPVNTGFGYRGGIKELITKASEVVTSDFQDWDQFIEMVPDVQYLTPEECIEFRTVLLKDHKIITHPELPKKPDVIGKLYNK